MSDKKHIDRLFQEHFKDFEASPSDAVWKNIEAELNQDKKKRRIIPIWWRYGGVAALLALLLTMGGTYFFNEENTNPIQVVDTEDNQTRSSNISNDIKVAVENDKPTQNNLENGSQNNAKVVESSTTKILYESSIVNTSSSTNKNESIHQSGLPSNKKANIKNSLTPSINNAFATNSQGKSENKNKSIHTAVVNNSKNTDETLQTSGSLINTQKAKELISNASKDNTSIAKIEDKEKKTLTIEEVLDKDKEVVENEKSANKWRITPNAAPVYFNSLGEGSSIDPELNANSKTGEIGMSYGISASYAVNNKLSVRSGINKVNLGYNTNNVVIYQPVGASSSSRMLQNVNSNSNTKNYDAPNNNISIISGETLSAKPDSFSSTSTSINQSLGYIEVPLEIQYALVNSKLGINVIGGFSSFFLSDNKVFSEGETGQRAFIGEADNINKISYSANFGVGFNYQVSKKIDVNLEPMFKYQINTFNDTSGNFTPFFIGVYTGFTIKF
ncbi:hypothetical protein QLS71_006570 [Mariniflexile litorale]|uniref:Outer membrane protein beta-barrel domain-containing protein n=1 Tax=Mariniflexile litorale TaxID=3045158 RepID=A0AAU7EJL3_9FLAO|nr:hypothetical protein [Mariniflexile sp. KMM 9835]MDQ8211388.1 hypothetical protein [Mariniflexile sp. KMM 9835]